MTIEIKDFIIKCSTNLIWGVNLNIYIKNLKNSHTKYLIFLKWGLISSFIGVIIGLVGTLFHYAIDYVVELREHHSWILWLLPITGIAIVLLYKVLNMKDDIGTNIVFLAIHKNQKVTIKTAPLIFIGTVLTHLGGGSSGREGAALQIGASITY